MTVLTKCHRCHRDYEASYREVLSGPDWKYCPECRDGKRGKGPNVMSEPLLTPDDLISLHVRAAMSLATLVRSAPSFATNARERGWSRALRRDMARAHEASLRYLDREGWALDPTERAAIEDAIDRLKGA